MPVFTSKTSTDPGPFDALHPAPVDHATEQATLIGEPGATSVDEDLENLFRFQEIPVTAEMRRELLGAKLPLASADQLADTQPPNKSGLSAPAPAPIGSALIDRHAPTEPALTVPQRLRDIEPGKVERSLLDGDSYSTTAPTLLSVRRRRLRNRRLVLAALATMVLAMLSGVAWRRYTRPPATLARDASSDRGTAPRPATPHIAGNRPASPRLHLSPDKPAGDAIREPDSEKAIADSQSAQPSLPAADATSSSPLSADPKSASREFPRASSPITSAPASAAESRTLPRATSAPAAAATPAAPGARTQPKGKAFDPEELIF